MNLRMGRLSGSFQKSIFENTQNCEEYTLAFLEGSKFFVNKIVTWMRSHAKIILKVRFIALKDNTQLDISQNQLIRYPDCIFIDTEFQWCHNDQ